MPQTHDGSVMSASSEEVSVYLNILKVTSCPAWFFIHWRVFRADFKASLPGPTLKPTSEKAEKDKNCFTKLRSSFLTIPEPSTGTCVYLFACFLFRVMEN